MWKRSNRKDTGTKHPDKSPEPGIFHLQAAFDALEDVVWILDNQHRILQANPATKKLFGLNTDQVIGHLCCSIVHNAAVPIPECPILRMCNSMQREKLSLPVGDKWYQVTVDPLISSQGELEGTVHIIRNITELRHRDEIIVESSHRLHDLIANAPFGAHLYRLNDDNQLIFSGANTSADKILGINHSQFIGKSIEEAFPPLQQTEIPERYRMAAKSGQTYSTEHISYSDDHGISGAYIVNAFQIGLNQMVAFFYDITERKKYEEELRKAKDRAEESDRLKSVFLANMSHEIRTPMNGIIGLSSMVEEPDIADEEKQRFLRIIRDNSYQLLHIINDLVDISKIESGQVDLHENETCLNKMLDSLYEFYLPLAEKRKLSLNLHKDVPSDACCILIDEIKLRQILENLISNALKFSQQGEVEIGYSIQPDMVEFFIKDCGIGIAPEQKDLVFDRFRQAEMSISQQYGGTGLGLSISKSFVETMGGKIWFDSTPGEGTTFHFTIPYKPLGRDIRKDSPHIPVTTALKGSTVLVVEDEMANFEYLDVVLRKLGVHTLHAQTGDEAMELFINHGEINLVLMDVKLPDRNGYEVVKEMLTKKKDLPIIAQTAYAFSDDREKAMIAGCVDYISKPIRKESLIQLIGKYLN